MAIEIYQVIQVVPFSSPSWRSLNLKVTPWKGHVFTIPIWITRYSYFNRRCIFKWCMFFGRLVHCTEAIGSSQVVGISDSVRIFFEAIPWKKILVPISGRWQQKYPFYFHPRLGKNPILTHIFSKELKPPTSFCVKLLMVSKIDPLNGAWRSGTPSETCY